MNIAIAELRECKSPTHLMTLAGLHPAEVTSPAIAACLDAIHGVPPQSKDATKLLRKIVKVPWWRPLTTRKARRVLALIGRRGLKSSGLVAWTMIFRALCVDYEKYAAPGSRIWFPIVAPMLAQAREALHGITSALDLLAAQTEGGITYELRDESGSPTIKITNPLGALEVVLAVFVASEVSVRGFAIPYFACDEAGFFPFKGPASLRSVVRAMKPGGITFADRRGSLLVSSPGAPEGMFWEQIERKTPPGALILRAPTWVANYRVTRETCWEDSEGDATHFAIEHEVSRFGYNDESWIDASKIVLGDDLTDCGPRPNMFCVVGLDVGQKRDSSAIVPVSAHDDVIGPDVSPVRSLIVEEIVSIRASLANPPSIEEIAGRACDVARKWGNAPIVCDFYAATEVQRVLERRGWHEWKPRETYKTSFGAHPPKLTYVIAPMNPERQTKRWSLLRQLVAGGRLHVPQDGQELVNQLAKLKAKTLASGSLKVEGARDDIADALALAAEIAMLIPPSSGVIIEQVIDSVWFGEGGQVHVRNHWSGGGPNTECPEWSPEWPEYVERMQAEGTITPRIRAWLERNGPVNPSPEIPGARGALPTSRRAGEMLYRNFAKQFFNNLNGR